MIRIFFKKKILVVKVDIGGKGEIGFLVLINGRNFYHYCLSYTVYY